MDSDGAKLLSQRSSNRDRVVIIMVDHPWSGASVQKACAKWLKGKGLDAGVWTVSGRRILAALWEKPGLLKRRTAGIQRLPPPGMGHMLYHMWHILQPVVFRNGQC